MCKIDKKKLIEKTKYVRCADEVRLVIENFPEEPEIDFDALYNEWCKNTKDWSELRSPYDQARSLRDFLKSKNLTVPKPFEITVKRHWTLKKEYYDFAIDMIQPIALMQTTDKEPKHKQYYDLHEEPDYSQVKVGDVVEVYHPFSNKPNYGIVKKNSKNILSIICNMHSINAFCISYSQIKSLTILKAAE